MSLEVPAAIAADQASAPITIDSQKFFVFPVLNFDALKPPGMATLRKITLLWHLPTYKLHGKGVEETGKGIVSTTRCG